MFKVLVAEDEHPIARGICKTIQATHPDFQDIEIVYNGKQALEALSTHSFDVAFLDINMPIMDGLTLLTKIKESQIKTTCIMLTSYEDFTYAKQAIKNNAYEYLLKPLDEEELEPLLHTLKLKFDRQHRESTLQSNTSVPHTLFENNSQNKDICLLGSLYFNPSITDNLSIESVTFMGSLYAQLHAIFIDFLPFESFSFTAGHDYGEYLIFMSIDIPNLTNIMNSLIEKTKENHIPFSFSYCREPVSISEIKDYYKKLSYYATQNYCYEQSLIKTYTKKQLSLPATSIDMNHIYKNTSITSVTTNTTFNSIVQMLPKIVTQSNNNKVILTKTMKYFISHLCNTLPHYMEFFDMEADILDCLDNQFTIANIIENLSSLMKHNFYFNIPSVENKENIAQQICTYIDSNYMYPFSNELLSEKFGFVPCYLRKIFKDAYSISPSEYLLQIRIDKSKELLSTGMLTKDVALAVGISEPLYFSKVFKKATGMTPSSYAKLYNNHI